MPPPVPALLLIVSIALAGCSSAITSTGVRDAQLAAAVKTALVNDPGLGSTLIEVRAAGGVVRLTGRVESDVQAGHAVALARSVAGVADVIADLRLEPADVAPAPAVDEQALAEVDREPHLLGVGVSIGRSLPSDSVLNSTLRVGPLVRLGTGAGFGPSIGFGWFSAPWRAAGPGAPVMGQIRVRPVMGGLAYGLRGDREAISFSLIGGIAFNSLSLPSLLAQDAIPLSVGNSLAVRPGASVWFDLSRRLALNISGSYLVTRPRVRVLEAGEIRTRSLRADTILVNTGIVYKIF